MSGCAILGGQLGYALAARLGTTPLLLTGPAIASLGLTAMALLPATHAPATLIALAMVVACCRRC